MRRPWPPARRRRPCWPSWSGAAAWTTSTACTCCSMPASTWRWPGASAFTLRPGGKALIEMLAERVHQLLHARDARLHAAAHAVVGAVLPGHGRGVGGWSTCWRRGPGGRSSATRSRRWRRWRSSSASTCCATGATLSSNASPCARPWRPTAARPARGRGRDRRRAAAARRHATWRHRWPGAAAWPISAGAVRRRGAGAGRDAAGPRPADQPVPGPLPLRARPGRRAAARPDQPDAAQRAARDAAPGACRRRRTLR